MVDKRPDEMTAEERRAHLSRTADILLEAWDKMDNHREVLFDIDTEFKGVRAEVELVQNKINECIATHGERQHRKEE